MSVDLTKPQQRFIVVEQFAVTEKVECYFGTVRVVEKRGDRLGWAVLDRLGLTQEGGEIKTLRTHDNRHAAIAHCLELQRGCK